MKTLLIALGGNALIKKGQKGTAEEQFENLRVPISQTAKLSTKYNLVITHGNGPQVGNLLLQQEAAKDVPEMPLEILVAQTQGQIGYMIESTLDEELMKLGISDEKFFLTVITYVKVDKNDPSFKNPTKPIGPAYSKKRENWTMKSTAKGWRRVVASPKPITIYEKREIKKLIEDGFIVIACGGGGIPVTKEGRDLEGIEAVIDKDLASAKLAEEVNANILIMVTDIENVCLNYGKKNQKKLDKLSIHDARLYLMQGQFPEGSMSPKIQAAINFIESGGEKAVVCHLKDIEAALEGKAGTQIFK